MKPPAGKFSEDIEKICQEQEELHRQFQSLRENELFQLREEVSNLKNRFWIAVAAYGTVAAIIALFGANTYFLEIPRKFDKAVAQASQDVPVEVGRQIGKQVEDAREQILKKLRDKMEDVVYASSDFQKALDEYKSGDMGLSELGKMVKARLRNEIVVSLYTDVLLKEQEYLSAFDLLKTLKDRKLIPDEYKRSVIYTNAGCIQWIESLNAEPREHQKELIAEARGYLERAVEEAQSCYIKTEIRRPLEWLVFVYLSQNQKKLALEQARLYKREGGKRADLVSHTGSQWFNDLVKIQPSAKDDLRSILADVFPESKSAVDPN